MQLEGEQNNGNKTKQNKAKQNVEFAEELRMGDGSMNFKCILGKKWTGNAVSLITSPTSVLSKTKLHLSQRFVPVGSGEPALRIPEGIQKSWLPIFVHHYSLSALNTYSSKSPLLNYFLGLLSFPVSTWAWVTTATLHTSTSRSKAHTSQVAIRQGHDLHCCWDVLGFALAQCQLASPRDQAHVDDTTLIDETDNQEQPSWERQHADRRGWGGEDNSHSPQLCIMH